jgi:hypothetical protein
MLAVIAASGLAVFGIGGTFETPRGTFETPRWMSQRHI